MLLRMFAIGLLVAGSQLAVPAQADNIVGRWVLNVENADGTRRGSRSGIEDSAIIVRQTSGGIEISFEAAMSNASLRRAQTNATFDGQVFRVRKGDGTGDVTWYLEGRSLVREQRIQQHGVSPRAWVTIKTYYKRG
jgi:hypothetical protein